MAAIQVEDLRLAVPGGAIQCLVTYPDSYAVRPAVVLLHEVFGVEEHMRELSRRLARAGYVAVLPDLYGRRGGPGKLDDVTAIRAAAASLSDTQVLGDIGACLDHLRTLPAVRDDRVAVLGYCLGGAFAIQAAGVHRPRLSAAIVFYGRVRYRDLTLEKPRHPIDALAGGCCPVQGHFGEEDQGIPLTEVAALRARLGELNPESAVYTYPGAGHGFFNDARSSYHREAAERSWARTRAFLQRHVGRP